MRNFIWITALSMSLLTVLAAEETKEDLVEMTLHSVSLDPRSNQPVIFLMDDDSRLLPIWVEFTQARSIFMGLQGMEAPRPMTHDLIVSILHSTEATIERIEVNNLKENTFFADITLSVNGQGHTIDSRPSDAIALAIRLDVPIFVAETVLQQASGLQSDSLLSNIAVVHAYGISVQELTPTLSQVLGFRVPHGVLVSNVDRESEAYREGLRRGDVVVKIDENELHHPADFRNALKQRKGRYVLQIVRDDKTLQFKIKGIVP